MIGRERLEVDGRVKERRGSTWIIIRHKGIKRIISILGKILLSVPFLV